MESSSGRRLPTTFAYPLCVFAVLVALLGTWAVAMPLFASPDEPAHLFKAYGTAHGEAIGTEVPGFQPTIRQFDVPLEMSTPVNPSLRCYFYLPNVPAGCGQSAGGPPISTAAVLPPFWYGLIGGGARIVGADTSQRAYRMVNAVLCAALFAAAFAIARRSREGRLSPLLLLVLTPITLMLSGTVNPNGFEIATFAVLWMLFLHADHPRAPTALGGFLVGGLFAADLLSRFASGLWVASVTVLVAVTLRSAGVRRFLDRRFLVPLVGTVALAVVALVAWSRYAGVSATDERTRVDESVWKTVTFTFDLIPEFALQVVGRLGWLDTRLPTAAYVLFAVLVVAELTGVVLSRNRRLIVAAALLLIGFVVLPIVVNVISAPTAGRIWQGRYSIPLVTGLAFLGMRGWREHIDRLGSERAERTIGGLRWLACICFAIIEVLGFWQTLRRYSVGANGKIWLTGTLDWRPAVAPMALIAVNAILVVGLCAVILRSTRGARVAADTEPAPVASSTVR